MNEPWKVELTLASGERVTAHINDEAIGFDSADAEDVELYVRKQVTNPPHPHWATIGDVDVFTQSLHAWTVL